MAQVTFTAGVARRGSLRRRLLLALLAVVVAAIGAVAWLAWDLRQFEDRYDGRVLPGVRVAGLDLAGMTTDEALAAVREREDPERNRRITLLLGDDHWTTTPGELGYRSDAATQVDAAVAITDDLTTWERLRLRWGRASLDHDLPVTSEIPRAPRRRLVREIAEVAARDAVDAALTWDRDRPTVTPERAGRTIDVPTTLTRLNDALEGSGSGLVSVAAEEIAPTVTTAAFDQILFLRQHRHQLDVWLDGRLVRSYRVAVGTGNYPTPTGRYEVTLKRYLPTWVNPSPEGWGRGMPARIGPGPNNPLGLRALNWSAPGAIRFHGTADVDSLGRDASHGCVRLSNPDIVELYRLVDEGAVIISTA
ncbi:MAG: L,D-transpeptidase family protein [Nitriliruptorales bacterium]|nr:L,D-transpeptidase family protein [Nitriliruptorales bacterium]